MPNKTFFNLSNEKQKKLIDASKKEFSRVSYENTSINKIIKDAEISRGSFYLYFEDKEDLYSYILMNFRKKLFDKIYLYVKQNNGDFIEAWRLLFDEIVEFCMKKRDINLFKNIFSNMSFTDEKRLVFIPKIEEINIFKEKLLKIINKELFKTIGDTEIFDCFELVMFTTNFSLAIICKDFNKMDIQKQKYYNRLNAIKYGLYKKKEEDNL